MVEGLLVSKLRDAIEKFRRAPNPSQAGGPFRLVSSVSRPAEIDEVANVWKEREVPDELKELWHVTRTARLFEDADYGQWGLVLLDAQASRERTESEYSTRPLEFRHDDVVVGEFLGDQELLVLAPSEVGARRLLIALPLDSRDEWHGVAEQLAEFLEAFFAAEGNKYWESTRV